MTESTAEKHLEIPWGLCTQADTYTTHTHIQMSAGSRIGPTV